MLKLNLKMKANLAFKHNKGNFNYFKQVMQVDI